MIRLRPERATSGQVEVTDAGKVIYKTEHHAVGRFPEPGDEELLAGPSRNAQIFDPLDFLAEVTQHIPDPGERQSSPTAAGILRQQQLWRRVNRARRPRTAGAAVRVKRLVLRGVSQPPRATRIPPLSTKPAEATADPR